MLAKRYSVYFTEYERGWGSKLLSVRFFETKTLAKEAATAYNKKYNNEKQVPDYYIVAEAGATVEVDETLLEFDYEHGKHKYRK